jgi:hypothetical protein
MKIFFYGFTKRIIFLSAASLGEGVGVGWGGMVEL